MRLAFDDRLIVSWPFDPEMAFLADRHYSRQSHGSPQFAGNGEKIILRDARAEVLFVWLLEKQTRWDGRGGFNCQIFRNESKRKASEIILEAEKFAVERWGPGRAFTFIDQDKIRLVKRRGKVLPGFCFIKAGWTHTGFTKKRGKMIFEKELS